MTYAEPHPVVDDFDPTEAVMPPEAPPPAAPLAAQSDDEPLTAETISDLLQLPLGNIGVAGQISGQGHTVAAGDINVTVNVMRGEAQVTDADARRITLDWNVVRAEIASVEPPGCTDEALSALERQRILVLVADRHEGRTTAVRYLAYRLAQRIDSYPPIERIELDKDDSLAIIQKGWIASRIAVVDLVDASDAQRDGALRDIASVRDTLISTGSYLMVTVPRRDTALWKSRFPDFVVPLERPRDIHRVFRGVLRDEIPEELVAELLADERFAELLRDKWPPYARRLAGLAAESYGGGARTVADIYNQVYAAETAWSDQLRKEFDAAEPWHRALTVAAAALEKAAPETVVTAATELLDVSRYSEEERPHPLTTKSVVTLVHDLTDVQVDPSTVRFTRPEFGSAVLPHVWAEYPELRKHLRAWLIRLPSRVRLDLTARDTLADRTVALAAEHDPGLVAVLAERWSSGPAPAPIRMPLVVRLLTTASFDPVIGRQVRSHLWQWAYHGKVTVDLQLAIAVVCGGTYGQIYPRNALTRLKHLARSDHDLVRAEVAAAVQRIAVYIGPYALLEYLTDWIQRPSPHQAEIVVRAWSEVLVNGEFRSSLGRGAHHRRYRSEDGAMVRFWRQALHTMPQPLVGALVDSWLGAAAELPAAQGDKLVELLVAAAGDNFRSIAQLGYAARPRYAPLPADANRRDQLVALIQTRLDELPLVQDFSRKEDQRDCDKLA